MKFTLLEITQDILNDISGDEVDSISDTVEATQIANIVRSTYFHLVSNRNFPEHKTLFQLDETTSATPVIMTMPDNMLTLEWLKFDQKSDPGAFSGGSFSGSAFDITESSAFTPLTYCDPYDFFALQDGLAWTGTDVDAFEFTTGSSDVIDIKYKTNAAPSLYTVLEDYYVIFDSLDTDITVDYLESLLTQCYGTYKPEFTMTDAFTPDLDATEFNWLMEEAKSACSRKLRQLEDQTANIRARRGMIRSQRQDKNLTGSNAFYKTSVPNLGRRKR